MKKTLFNIPKMDCPVINFGVIVAGLLVYSLESNIPDLVIGLIVFVIVVNGAIRILKI